VSTLSFKQQMEDIVRDIRIGFDDLYDAVAEHCFRSITVGSPITGAPGQPVKTGRLLKSWRRQGTARSKNISIYTQVPYAPIIEDNLRGATLRSSVGGFHSVKMTVMGFHRIVTYELEQLHAGSQPIVYKGGAWRDAATGRFASGPL